MLVLALSLFCVAVMYVRKPVLAVPGGTVTPRSMLLTSQDFAFHARIFFPLSFGVTGAVWSACVYCGETGVRDMVGTGVTGIVGGYLLQLLILWQRDKE